MYKNETKVDSSEKMKNYKLQKLWKILKPYIKMEKTIIKLGDIKSKKQKIYQLYIEVF